MARGGFILEATWPAAVSNAVRRPRAEDPRCGRGVVRSVSTGWIPIFAGGAQVQRSVSLTFPREILGEPILYAVGQKFKVIPNIRGASISETEGFVALELTGEADEVDRAVQYFKDRGVKVEPITG